MNNKGFTLIELLTVIVILSIITGITLTMINMNMNKTKEKTEEIFVDTIKDAMELYLSSASKNENNKESVGYIKKKNGCKEVYKYSASVNFKSDVMESKYVPLTESEFVNPGYEDVACDASKATVTLYRDDDYVFYYEISKVDGETKLFDCLMHTDKITILPDLERSCS